MLRLVEPAPLYKAAILDAVAEMQAIGEWDISPDAFAARFDDMLRELAAAKDPVTGPPGVLPYEDFWLMEKDIWIGLLTLGPHINEQFLHSGGHIGYVVRPSKRRCGYGTVLLRLGLDRARERGLQRVLLACDETNIGSRKIIETNGGQLENAVDHTLDVSLGSSARNDSHAAVRARSFARVTHTPFGWIRSKLRL